MVDGHHIMVNDIASECIDSKNTRTRNKIKICFTHTTVDPKKDDGSENPSKLKMSYNLKKALGSRISSPVSMTPQQRSVSKGLRYRDVQLVPTSSFPVSCHNSLDLTT